MNIIFLSLHMERTLHADEQQAAVIFFLCPWLLDQFMFSYEEFVEWLYMKIWVEGDTDISITSVFETIIWKPSEFDINLVVAMRFMTSVPVIWAFFLSQIYFQAVV